MPILWLICILLGTYVGQTKNRSAAGFFLTLLFGPLGFLAICAMPTKEKRK